MIVQTALTTGTQILRKAGVAEPGRDARKLMAACLGVNPGRLSLHLHDPFDPESGAVFFADIMDRGAGKPVSHLLGWREFYGRRFRVDSDVLDPRPETETLVEAALSEHFLKVLDLGTGSGCILLTLLAERPGSTGIGTDMSPAALAVAELNARDLRVDMQCDFVESNWFDSIGGQFDLIVSNPPYIAAVEMAGLAPELSFEPRQALTDESDGLSAYRIITAGAGVHLKPGGHLMVEIGWTQGANVAGLFRAAGFEEVNTLPDLDGRDRVVRGVWPGKTRQNL